MTSVDLLLAGAMLLGGYLLGSASSAIIVCRLMGLPDPRTTGSGNPGATNVLRGGSKLGAALTLTGDTLKGLIAVLRARAVSDDPLFWCAAGAGAFFGHLFPLYFGFAGGKGVATLFGVVFGLSWLSGLLALVTWLAMTLTFRYSSVSALVTFALLPGYLWLLQGDLVQTACLALLGLVMFWRHSANIARLLRGEETRVGERSAKSS